MIDILPINAFEDNYIWALRHQNKAQNNHCAVVDPGDAAVVLAFLQQQQLQLTDILITHHHWDHTDGLPELCQHFPNVNIIGLKSPRVPLINREVAAGERVALTGLPLEFEVTLLPGHTRDHVSYHNRDWLFCGDTLFSAGCGRLFEGTHEQMLSSLHRLSALNDHTQVYCTHEYTLANVEFALAADPGNTLLQDYQKWAKQQRKMSLPTLPTTIGQQKAINPFLRGQNSAIKQHLEQKFALTLNNELDVFTCLRNWKDKF